MKNKSKAATVLMFFAGAAAMTACQSGGDTGSTHVRGIAAVGNGCSSKDSICLGLRYISYDEGNGPISSAQQAATDVAAINRIWAQCGIEFQIDSYEAVDPTKYGLGSGAAAANQTNAIRNAFNDGRTLLVVYTGYWGTTKNAWTSMPGSPPYGAILESSVVNYPNIVAHELGHYLGLDHYDVTTNVMDTLIYPNSSQLESWQCDTARGVATGTWSAMLR